MVFSLVCSVIISAGTLFYAFNQNMITSVVNSNYKTINNLYVSDFGFTLQFFRNISTLMTAEKGDVINMTIQSRGGGVLQLKLYEEAIRKTNACVVGYVPNYAMSVGQMLAASVHRLVYNDNAIFLLHLPRYINSNREIIYIDESKLEKYNRYMMAKSYVLSFNEKINVFKYRDITISGKTIRKRMSNALPTINPFSGKNNDVKGNCD